MKLSRMRINRVTGVLGGGQQTYISAFPADTPVTPITYGPNLITSNADMETGNPGAPTGWSAVSADLTSEADERTDGVGSYSLQVAATAAYGSAYRLITTTTGKFLRLAHWSKYVSGTSKSSVAISKYSNRINKVGTTQEYGNVDWAKYFMSGRVIDATSLAVWPGTRTAIGATAKFDDVEVEEIDFASMFKFTSRPYSSGKFLVSVRVTNPLNASNTSTFDHWAGMALCWDNPTNPQNGLLAVLWFDMTAGTMKCSLLQITGGTTIATIAEGTISTISYYTNTEGIVVRLTDGGAASIWYGGTLMGTGTVSDATVLAGRNMGIFASGNEGNIPLMSHLSIAPDTAPLRLTVLGDSIETNTHAWPLLVSSNKTPIPYTLTNYAVGGATILNDATHSYLDAQVALVDANSADVIIIALGTNELSTDSAAIQADMVAQIAAMQASNPGVKIIWSNILPRWTNTGGGTVVDKSVQRAAIVAGCATAGITCWDTFTDPWITATDTTDGLHPNTSGNRKYTDRALALLSA